MRILVVRLSHLGDVVHALGVHHALHEAYPTAELAWAIQPEFADLVDGLPGLAHVVPFERRGGWRAWPRLRRRLRRLELDLAVDCQANLKSAGVLLASGAPSRIGLAREDWREPLGARVLTEQAAPVPGGARHAMDRMTALVRHVAPGRLGPLRLDAGLTPAERRRGEELLDRHLPQGAARAALVHVSTGGDVRGWPRERWERLVRRLVRSGRGALLLSGPAEADVGRALARALPGSPLVSHWIGQKGLRGLAGVFEAAARRGLALIGCDSGPTHLAAASGMPAVLLAGPQDPARTGPWPPGPRGPHVTVLARERPACQPCLARTCEHAAGPVCMHRIEDDDVLAALARVSPLEGSAPLPAPGPGAATSPSDAFVSHIARARLAPHHEDPSR